MSDQPSPANKPVPPTPDQSVNQTVSSLPDTPPETTAQPKPPTSAPQEPNKVETQTSQDKPAPSGTKTHDVLAIGSIYLDINTTQFPFEGSIPAEDERVGGSYILSPGGSAVNFAKVSSFLGLKPIFIGKTGTDDLGDLLTKLLQNTGVTPAIIKSGSSQTNLGLNFMNVPGETVLTTIGTANQTVSPSEVFTQVQNHIEQVKYLFIGSYFKIKALIPEYPKIIALAKKTNTKVILDHGTLNVASAQERQGLIELLKNIDYYLPKIEEFSMLFQAQDLEYALNTARSYTNACIVVKQAQHGATGSHAGQTAHVPAFPVSPLSTIGAGDSFNAGFIKAMEEGYPLENAIRFANATAALVISRKTLPTKEEIDSFIASRHTDTVPG